ncbi:MAG: protein kinase, partial [Planctomycetes bacterium]|nr:protein kinase [Planctomycetota bacterium]
MSQQDESLVGRLVFEGLAAFGRDGDTGLAAVLARHPELAAEARRRLEVLREFGLLDQDRSAAPLEVGRYQLSRRIGSGGSGTVFLAQDADVGRLVAVKVLRREMLGDRAGSAGGPPGSGPDSVTREVLARFKFEQRALAAMSHPTIARIFDSGVTETGEPFFVMELIVGLPCNVWCDRQRATVRARLELIQMVCRGVQHAHLRGVVHRDLKPGNVLVTEQDGGVVPKVLDFGLAKALNRDLAAATLLTEEHRVLGTLEYMSPEQAAGDITRLDARADIYSLGVMLYEALTGQLPLPSEELRRSTLFEAARILQEREPELPSARLQASSPAAADAVAAARQTTGPALRRAVRGDLDWIVMKAMAKEPARRYESAGALADDIQRYLEARPVLAGPPGIGYRVTKFVRRYRFQVIAATVALLALLGGAVATFAQYLRAEDSIREFNHLAAVVRHRELVEAEAGLAALPGDIGALQAWLHACDEFTAARREIEATAAAVRDRADNEAGAGGSFSSVFALDSERFLYERLEQLLQDLDALPAIRSRVEERLAWAGRIEALTRAHPNAKATWDEARAAIARADGVVADERYAEHPIDLSPQTGLVPIGMNPVTGLWEFYDLRSAWDPEGAMDASEIAIPEHRSDGSIAVTGETGIVFVLLPGGRFMMGVGDDEESPDDNEKPARTVALDPFFLARHELTQGQWRRLTREEPSHYRAGELYDGETITNANPVEQVSQQRLIAVLGAYGLLLPTEAQWEY